MVYAISFKCCLQGGLFFRYGILFSSGTQTALVLIFAAILTVLCASAIDLLFDNNDDSEFLGARMI